MTEDKKVAIKKAAMGARKMAVIMWCVLAITAIMFMHIMWDKDAGYAGITAMALIAALGGVDVWKQGLLDKVKGDRQ